MGDLIGMMISAAMTLPALMALGNGEEEELAQNEEKPASAEITPEDQKIINRSRQEGVDPGKAKMLAQTATEAGLTANDIEQSQQQQITMRG